MGQRNILRVGAVLSAVGLAAVGCGSSPDAENYPDQPIEIIVPWAAGGSSDVLVRAFAQAYEEANEDQVLVVNRPGGGSAIGAAEAARADADGYTMLHSSASTFITVPLRENVDYGPEDFRSVVSLGDQPVVLVASPDSGWEELDDVTLDSELTIAVTAVGNVLHLIGSNFVDEAGGTSAYLPFDGSNETVMAVANGNADLAVAEANIALPQVEAGEVVALAVATTERLDELPDVQTFGEQGYERSHDRYSRVAISVPGDTPDEIVEAFQEGAANAMEQQSWLDYAETTLLQPPAYEAEDFMNGYVVNETEWTRESFGPAGVELADE